MDAPLTSSLLGFSGLTAVHHCTVPFLITLVTVPNTGKRSVDIYPASKWHVCCVPSPDEIQEAPPCLCTHAISRIVVSIRFQGGLNRYFILCIATVVETGIVTLVCLCARYCAASVASKLRCLLRTAQAMRASLLATATIALHGCMRVSSF